MYAAENHHNSCNQQIISGGSDMVEWQGGGYIASKTAVVSERE